MNFYLVIFLIFLLLFSIMAPVLRLFTVYAETKKVYSKTVAYQDLRRTAAFIVIAIVYFGIGFAIFLPLTNFNIAYQALVLPLLLGGAIYASTWHGRRRQAGAVLLNLGRELPFSSIALLYGGASLVFAVMGVILCFSTENSETAIQRLLMAANLSCIGVVLLSLGLSNIEIRERGICYRLTFLKWKMVEGYRWIRVQNNTLCLRYKARWPPSGYLKFQVGSTNKGRIEEFLAHYLPGNSNFD